MKCPVDHLAPGGRPPVFPGGIAGASLKYHLTALACEGRRGVFPGGIAGASLKCPRECFPCPASVVFPGGIAGASLKSLRYQIAWIAWVLFSPAESPGPH